MRGTAFQLAADLHQKYGFLFLADRILTLFGGKAWIQILQLLRSDKSHLMRQQRVLLQLREHGAHGHFRGAHAADNAAHNALQIFDLAVLGADHLFPVPLVHINAVQVVQLFIAANGVHIGIQAVAGIKPIVTQGLALPLGKALHHLALFAAVQHIKLHRAFYTVQIVVQAGAHFHKQRGRHTVQAERAAQIILKQAFDQADGTLCIIQVQHGLIALRNKCFAHIFPTFFFRLPAFFTAGAFACCAAV